MAKDTLVRFVERATRLYEQEREKPYDPSRLGQYVKQWLSWLTAGDIFRNATLLLVFKNAHAIAGSDDLSSGKISFYFSWVHAVGKARGH